MEESTRNDHPGDSDAVTASTTCEKLEKARNELQIAYEGFVQKLNQQHQTDITELENRLKEFYTGECEKLQNIYIEEAEKYKTQLQEQKNPQIMYLEQELESLKAVLEIKNEKLHQQDIKLMKMEKLVDNNTALVDKLKRFQQENEELKARMDKHMAISRQLSTEQAVLQESLEKESKVNKRLSMENEELLWKLHNGDLCSPKRSPTSPAIPFQSPRNSGSFPSPSISPR
ncbi:hypothetical protein J1605_001195 [Eschrichtius robustus]|uniref:Microtubule-associated tumor suppressor 1 n=1 Tax=Eschrichtius robustus TaxID=9764 RepID=A0AB34GDI2_ESCRO|nr:hypothetical protein J1605_001195 [Eschrichtius robustus]